MVSHRIEFGILRWMIEQALADTHTLRGKRAHRRNGLVFAGLMREHMLMAADEPALLEDSRLRLRQLSSDGIQVVLTDTSLVSPRVHLRPPTAHLADPDLLNLDLQGFAPMGSAVIFVRQRGGQPGNITLARVQSLDSWAYDCPVWQEIPLPDVVVPAGASPAERAATNDDGDDLGDVVGRNDQQLAPEYDETQIDEPRPHAVGGDDNVGGG